ncbi:MAG: hypothetical protein QX198_13205 [Methylococcaceae bacterium]
MILLKMFKHCDKLQRFGVAITTSACVSAHSCLRCDNSFSEP